LAISVHGVREGRNGKKGGKGGKGKEIGGTCSITLGGIDAPGLSV